MSGRKTKKIPKSLSDYMSKLGKKGAAKAKKTVTTEMRREFGKRGGRKASPIVKELMRKHGISRQAAHQRLRRAGVIKAA